MRAEQQPNFSERHYGKPVETPKEISLVLDTSPLRINKRTLGILDLAHENVPATPEAHGEIFGKSLKLAHPDASNAEVDAAKAAGTQLSEHLRTLPAAEPVHITSGSDTAAEVYSTYHAKRASGAEPTLELTGKTEGTVFSTDLAAHTGSGLSEDFVITAGELNSWLYADKTPSV